jgi:hypothetical protein
LFPVDRIKLAREFIVDLVSDQSAVAIVKAASDWRAYWELK